MKFKICVLTMSFFNIIKSADPIVSRWEKCIKKCDDDFNSQKAYCNNISLFQENEPCMGEAKKAHNKCLTTCAKKFIKDTLIDILQTPPNQE